MLREDIVTLSTATDATLVKGEVVFESEATPCSRWRGILARADRMEMRMVRWFAAMTRFRVVRSVTIAINLLGNGWVYAPIALGLILAHISNAWAIVGAALLATGFAHALYALIKRGIARLRPFERDPSLQPLARVLDRYSFPSGHCMTLTAVLVPIVRNTPDVWPIAAAALGVLAWGRMAAAHHYPSDTIAGVCLGAAISVPVSIWLVPV